MTARRADESRTTTWEAIQCSLKPSEQVVLKKSGICWRVILLGSRVLYQARMITV